MKALLCPICEMGNLHPQIEQIEVEHLGRKGHIDSHYSVCDACHSEQATVADARTNKRKMIAFKKQAQGLLTGSQIRNLRKQWQLTQTQAAKVFGGGTVAFAKYEVDDVMQSEAMDKLLRLAATLPSAREQLMEAAGIDYWEKLNIIAFPRKKVSVQSNSYLNNEACYG